MRSLDRLPRRQPRQRRGRRSRDKGNRAERAIVAFLQDSGPAGERVPLSASTDGKYVGDVTSPLLGRDMCAEVKVREHGFGQLYAWLDGRQILIVRQDRREALVILPLHLAAEIAGHAERRLLKIDFNQSKKCPAAMAGQRDYANARNSQN
jgi:Holliday junction resolvase